MPSPNTMNQCGSMLQLENSAAGTGASVFASLMVLNKPEPRRLK